MIGIILSDSPIPTSRIEKGRSLLEELNDYVVLDLETTGLDPKYDSIIEVAAIQIHDGEIVQTFQSLINPGFEIGDFITDLTGITNEMLLTAPNLEQVFPEFLSFVGDSTVIGHSVNFDVNFIYDNCMYLFDKPFRNDFIDTMRLSRRLFKEERHHRLIDLVSRFKIAKEVEHRALSDVLMTNQCYVYMKKYIQEHDLDFSSLLPSKKGTSAKDILPTCTEFDENNFAFSKCFVFTGVLDKMSRSDAMQAVVNFGGTCADSVTRITNYLVLGSFDYSSSIKGGKSTKQKKAEKLKIDGFDIEIISENVFYDLISSENNEISKAIAENCCPSEWEDFNNSMCDSLGILNALVDMIKSEFLIGSEIRIKKNASKYDSIIVTSKKTAYRNTDTGELLLGRVVTDKIGCSVSFSRKYSKDFGKAGIEYCESKFGNNFIQIDGNTFSRLNQSYDALSIIVNKIFIDLFSFPSFGCCSSYVQCSDEKRCIHPDLAYATACQYRGNLESGKIFYGKNRNI